MVAVDTNVLLRVLVDDPGSPGQCKAARRALERAEKVYIPDVVLAETVWVLASSYGFGRRDIRETLTRLLENERFVFTDAKVVQDAARLFAEAGIDFADGLILAASRAQRAPLLSFDAKLAKLDGARAVR